MIAFGVITFVFSSMGGFASAFKEYEPVVSNNFGLLMMIICLVSGAFMLAMFLTQHYH
jgi:hypothetical protein